MTAAREQRPVCYYNGACPICRREIEHYKGGADGDAVLWHDLGPDPLALESRGIDRAAAKRQLHVIDAEGRLHAGVAAFIVIWRSMPRYRWLGRVVGWRPLRPLVEALYDRVIAPLLFAWNRHRGRI